VKVKAAVLGDPIAAATLEFWKSLGIDVELVEISEEMKQEMLAHPSLFFRRHTEGFDVAFMDPLTGEKVVRDAAELISEVKDLGWADVLLHERAHLWPRLLQREALRLSIIRAAPDLDSHSVGYVTGKGPAARMVAAVLIQLGFENLAILSDDPARVAEELQGLKRKYFGIQIKFLSEPEMTLQPNNGSIIVNTLSHDVKSDILDDLPYLNYIKKEGLVVDLPLEKGPNQLIDEAKHVEMRVLNGITVRGQRDFLILSQRAKWDGEILPISESEYLSKWDAFEMKQEAST
jgi:hypothetical protein